MKTSLDQITNIRPVQISSRRKDYKPLYAILCGIECEYAISVLKKNKEDGLFKQIALYFTTQEMSAKNLFVEGFSFDDEILDLHS